MWILHPNSLVSVCRKTDGRRQWQPHVTRKELRFAAEVDFRRVQVSCEKFTASVTTEDGVITEAEPLAQNFVGQPLENLLRWAGNHAVDELERIHGTSGAIVFREGEWLILARREFVEHVHEAA